MSQAAPPTVPELRGVADILTFRSNTQSERVALLVDGACPFTMGEWERCSNSMAHGLLELGCGRGERVGLLFGNDDWLEYAAAYVAALKVGAATVHVSNALPRSEIERRFDQCNVRWVIHSSRLEPPAREHVVAADQLHRRAEGPVTAEVEPTDLADIVYTAGTTGAPKGVEVPHADHLHGFDPEQHRAYDESRYFLAPFPAGTSSSQNIVLFGLSGAPTVLLLSRLDPASICRLVERLGVDEMMVTPGMAVDLLGSDAARRYDLSSVRRVATGASAMPAALVERMTSVFPNAQFMQFYLSLESIPSMTAMAFDPERPGAVGLPAPGTEVAIRDEAGRELPAGEVGEIWMRTEGRTRRYAVVGADIPRTFVDGWVRMGDLGYLDEEGCLYFFDRVGDAIECGGRRLSTLRIENVLYRCPDVQEACVVGIPHSELGQAVGAAVVLERGASVAGLEAFAGARLEEDEVPVTILRERSLPRGLIGKVLKREVRKWFDPECGEEARRAHRHKRYW